MRAAYLNLLESALVGTLYRDPGVRAVGGKSFFKRIKRSLVPARIFALTA
jgi:hypothetical protein